MPQPDITPEQRRRLQEAEARLQDPDIQRRIREARAALTQHPAVVSAAGRMVDAVVPILRWWNENINGWLKQVDFEWIRTSMRTLGEAFLRLVPPNARSMGVESWPTLQRLGAEEQLCLSWVPSESLARSLCDAHDRAARDQLLLEAAPSVLSTCQVALDEVQATIDETEEGEDVWPTQLTDVVELVASCVRAASDGHWAAAQALATCATDSLLTQHIAGRKGHAFVKSKLKLIEEKQFAALVLGPVLAAVESSMRQHASWGSAAPTHGYSRHATIHAASAEAFGEVTALKAIIMATSLLKASVSPLLWVLIDIIPTGSSSSEENR